MTTGLPGATSYLVPLLATGLDTVFKFKGNIKPSQTKMSGAPKNNTREDGAFIEQQGGHDSTSPEEFEHIQDFIVPQNVGYNNTFTGSRATVQSFGGIWRYSLNQIPNIGVLASIWQMYKIVSIEETVCFNASWTTTNAQGAGTTFINRTLGVFGIAPWNRSVHVSANATELPDPGYISGAEYRLTPITADFSYYNIMFIPGSQTERALPQLRGPGTGPINNAGFINVGCSNPAYEMEAFGDAASSATGKNYSSNWLALASSTGPDTTAWRGFVCKFYVFDTPPEAQFTLDVTSLTKFRIAFKGKYWLQRTIFSQQPEDPYEESSAVNLYLRDGCDKMCLPDRRVREDDDDAGDRRSSSERDMQQPEMHSSRALPHLLQDEQAMQEGDTSRPRDNMATKANEIRKRNLQRGKGTMAEILERKRKDAAQLCNGRRQKERDARRDFADDPEGRESDETNRKVSNTVPFHQSQHVTETAEDAYDESPLCVRPSREREDDDDRHATQMRQILPQRARLLHEGKLAQ